MAWFIDNIMATSLSSHCFIIGNGANVSMTFCKDHLLQTARNNILKAVYQETQKYAIKIRFS